MDSADRRIGRGHHRALGVRRRDVPADPGLEATLRTEIDEVRGLADELVISLLLLDRDDPATVSRVVDGQRERLSRFERRVRTDVARACLQARAPDRDGTSESAVARPVDPARRERRGPARRLDLATALAAAVAAVLAVVTMGSGTSSPRLLSDRTDRTGGASAPDDRAAAGEGDVSGPAEEAEPGAGTRGDASSGLGGDAGQGAASSSGFAFGGGASDGSVLAPIGDLLASLLDITRLEGILSRLLAGNAGDGSESFDQLPSLAPTDVQNPEGSPGGALGTAAPGDEPSPQTGPSRSGEPAEEPTGPDETEDDGRSVDLDVSSTVPPTLTDPDESSEEERSTDGPSPQPDDGETDGTAQDGDRAEDGEASDGSADASGAEGSTRSDSPDGADESDETNQTSGYRPLAGDSSGDDPDADAGEDPGEPEGNSRVR